jgi:hypothetical protein
MLGLSKSIHAKFSLVFIFAGKLPFCQNSLHKGCLEALVMATFHPVETNAGTTTTWIPITTQLPLVPACSAAIYSQDRGKLVAFDPFYYTIDTAFTTQCIPLEATEWWNQASTSATVSSLGPITCPQAYTTAFNISANGGSTRVGCCPS